MAKETLPESNNQEESLISSSTIPTMNDVESQFAELIQMSKEKSSDEGKRKKNKKAKATVSQGEESQTSEPSEAAPAMQFEADDMEEIVCFPLDAWFVRQDKKRLNNVERRAFSTACARLANKWLPTVSSQWKEEIGFAMCLGTIFMARMEIPKNESATGTASETESKAS